MKQSTKQQCQPRSDTGSVHQGLGRPLGPYEQAHFKYGRELHGTFSFDCKKVSRKQARWDAAFRRVVKQSEVLRMHIDGALDEGDGSSSLAFVPVKSPKDLPTLDFQLMDKSSGCYSSSKQEQVAMARHADKYLAPILAAFQDVSSPVQRKPVSLLVLLSERRVSITVIMPHCFGDGCALATIPVMLLAYVLLPRPFWFALDTMHSKGHPTSVEMAAKGDYASIMAKYNGQLSLIPGPYTSALHSAEQLHIPQVPPALLYSWNKVICFGKAETKALKAAIRAKGQKVTPVFVALATKLAMHLLRNYSSAVDDNDRHKTVKATTPFDSRKHGKWHDKRDSKQKFPVIGDYASSIYTAMSVGSVLDMPLEGAAETVLRDVSRLKDDTEHRVGLVSRTTGGGGGYFFGSSSVQMPTERLSRAGITNIELDTVVNFCGLSYMWVYVISTMKEVHVTFRMGLPLTGASDGDIEQVLAEICKGTCLDMVGTAVSDSNAAENAALQE